MTLTPQIDNIEDGDALIAYLRARGAIGDAETPQVRVLAGGVSNRTVWIERKRGAEGEAWVIKQALAKLRVQADWFSSVERIHREADGLRWFSHRLPNGCVPVLVFEDEENHILAMSAVPVPHENWKQRMLAGRIDADYTRQFGEILAAIQRSAETDRAAADSLFGDQSFFETLRLEAYYAYSGTQVPAAADFLERLIDETRGRRVALVHGDYSPKNILIHDGRLTILDFETMHIGDPAFDLGFSMTHLLSKALFLPAQRQALRDGALIYWQSYCAALGTPGWIDRLEEYAVRHTLACLLARVAGRSPLEYLTAAQRDKQQQIVLSLIGDPPTRVPDLIAAYHSRLT